MPDPQQAEEPRGDLVSGAAAEGFRVTRTQLRQWQQAGLLPQPRQRGLGRGKGSETLYPAGSIEQLLVICRALKNKRRRVEAAWALWWRGVSIPEKLVRELCIWEIERLEVRISDVDFDADYEDGDAFNPVEIIDTWARHARLPKPLSSIRKLLGPGRFATFVVFSIKAAAGANLNLSRNERDLDTKTITKGLGQSDSQDAKRILGNLAWVFDLRKYREELAAASFEELCETRDEVRKAANLFTAFGAIIAADRDLALDPELVSFLAEPDAAIGTNLVLLWLWLRKLPKAPLLYERMLGVARDVASGMISVEEALELLDTVNSEDPPHV
jgi:hypothetical protein